jgi:ABC-type lipoprotein release transport system permease subunit
MLLALAWRNVWRNARRSLITMVALAVGVAGIVALHSYRESAYGVIVRDITTGLVGHLQVHGRGYQEAPAIGTLVRDPVQVEAAVAGALPGALTERRVLGAGLAGAGERSAPVAVLGLPPGTSALYRLETGAEPKDGHEVLLGRDLARDLELGPGGEVVLVSQAVDGSVANDRYTVAGTFTSSSAELDATSVVMPLAAAQDFFGLGAGVHQLVVRLPEDREDVTPEVTALRSALDLQALEALSWGEMLPNFKDTMESKRKGQRVMDLIVFLIVGLGVFNAMTMSVFERTREFGVLGALGTRPRRLLAMVVLEALIQGLLAFTVGLTLAALLLFALGTVNLGSVMQGDVMGVRMPTVLELKLLPGSIRSAAVTAFFTALVGAVLPALRAARLAPVEALRHT